jgi:uncharacterized protein YceK
MNLRNAPDPKFHTDEIVPLHRIYGGVRMDTSILRVGFDQPSWKNGGLDIVCVILILVDIPLSAIADTLALPFTVSEALGRPFGRRETVSKGAEIPQFPDDALLGVKEDPTRPGTRLPGNVSSLGVAPVPCYPGSMP